MNDQLKARQSYDNSSNVADNTASGFQAIGIERRHPGGGTRLGSDGARSSSGYSKRRGELQEERAAVPDLRGIEAVGDFNRVLMIEDVRDDELDT